MKTNVLIFPAGEINSVELHEALSHNVNINVFGASSVDRHGPYIFKNYVGTLPLISKPNFFEEFNKLIKEWNIDVIFPTHDSVVLFLMKNQEKLNAKVIAADLETSEICRDKKKTYEMFLDCVFCPTLYNSIKEYPCFIKPREGQGAQGAKCIETKGDIPDKFKSEEYVITEYLPGNELTVDCITDKEGKLQAVLPRKRNRLMAGVCISGETMATTNEISNIATTINDRLKFVGLWYFQLKQDRNGKYKLLEISTRCAGTMGLSRARGINLPLLSVYAALGKDICIFENPYEVTMDRTLISRYKLDYTYNTVYIDYDDTIIEGTQIVLPVMRFIYQCHNNGTKIILISRHNEDHEDSIEESLEKHCICKTLFDDICCLTFEQEKYEYIKEKKSIFIDNAYAERKKVHDKIGIPVFDIEGIEVLTDWRA